MMTFFQVAWFFLIGFLFAMFTVLDGMNLGAASWHLLSKTEKNRQDVIRAVGPFWDGNEVWLVAGGGALFAAFPDTYSVVFSKLYIPMTLLLMALITRAVSVEIRNKIQGEKWRSAWDAAFSVSSIAIVVLLGVAFGNVIQGFSLDEPVNTIDSFIKLLNPMALLTGIFALFMLLVHGASFTAMRITGEMNVISIRRAVYAWPFYLASYLVLFIWSISANTHLLENYKKIPVLWILPIIATVMMILQFYYLKKGRIIPALAASSAAIVFHFIGIGAAVFPRLAANAGNLSRSLTIYNSSSSEKTLGIMLVIAMIGVPLAVIYTVYVYRKIRISESAENAPY